MKVTPNLGKPDDRKGSHAQNMPSSQLVPGTKQALLPLLQHVLRVLFKAVSTHSYPAPILRNTYISDSHLISYSPCNSKECFQRVIRHSQDLSVLLMQAVYLPAALLTSVGVSQITCNCRNLDFAWCRSWSDVLHITRSQRAAGR